MALEEISEEALIDYADQGCHLLGIGAYPLCPDWEEDVWSGYNKPMIGLEKPSVLFLVRDTHEAVFGALIRVERALIIHDRGDQTIWNTGLVTAGKFKNAVLYTVNRGKPDQALVFGRWKDSCETNFQSDSVPMEDLKTWPNYHRDCAKESIVSNA